MAAASACEFAIQFRYAQSSALRTIFSFTCPAAGCQWLFTWSVTARASDQLAEMKGFAMLRAFFSRWPSSLVAIAAAISLVQAAAHAQPANESCATAIPLTVGTVALFNSGTANDALPFTCTAGFRDVWFSFVAPVQTSYVISSCDVAVSVYEGACPADDTTLIACGRASCTGALQSIRFDALAGLTYRIRVGSTSSGGSFTNKRISVEFANPITYQGRLLENNAPYNGLIDVDFARSAFADGTSSNFVASHTVTNVQVVDGLFSATFPASSDVLWKAIGVPGKTKATQHFKSP